MSKDCYLYRQRNISNELRIKNLRLLVQRPEAHSSATIYDLRHVLGPKTTVIEPGSAACNIAENNLNEPKVNTFLHKYLLFDDWTNGWMERKLIEYE